jgi:hypothetical protein
MMPGETREEAEAEIAAIFARLKEEIGHGRSGLAIQSETRSLAARAQGERMWAVTAERPFEQPPNRRGRVQAWIVVPIKRVLRKLMRWYVEPLAAQQRSFNLTVLNLVDELAERVESLEQQRKRDSAEPGG